MQNKNENVAGFTLLETVAATALAGLVIAVLGQVFIQSAHTQKLLNGRVTAMLLGSSKLNEVVRQAEPNSSGTFLPPYQDYHWECQTQKGDGGVEKLEFVVKWGEEAGEIHTKTLQYFRLAR